MNSRTKRDGWEVYSHFTVLFLAVIGIIVGATFVIGIVLKFIGWIVPAVIIGLGFWACCHYRTNRSIYGRFHYRTTAEQRNRIERRLWGRLP
jgi:hypothetical protein